MKRTMPSSPLVARQCYAEYLKSKRKRAKFVRTQDRTSACVVVFEHTLRGIAFHAGLDAHRLLTVE